MQSSYSYKLTRGHLNRLQNSGLNKCQRCDMEFDEGNIIVTSTSYRYCYKCATSINLISDNTQHDLHNDKFVLNTLNEIKKLATKYSIDEEISSFASFLIKTAFENTKHITKNQLGLSCAAISLAASQLGKNDNLWNQTIPVSSYVLKKKYL